ncbi:sensor histidine kinase [Variovorax sp. IB41]|uniref:sensor histidine kinase n=1 Tax=Variovorax sp. IB41 TaxID=2779370 RepID=UPI0018E78106|nr:histidine kinase [Variovorax sp. IB41]MBJ2157686.1 histidine kinase [Variovorax sp. IB41]
MPNRTQPTPSFSPRDGLPTPEILRGRLDRFALVALGSFWLTFIALYTLHASLVEPAKVWSGMGPRVAIAAAGAALSWLMYLVVEIISVQVFARRIAWVIAVSVPTAILFAASDALIGGVIKPDLSIACPNTVLCTWSDIWKLEVDNTLVWMFVFSAWGLLHLSLRSAIETSVANERAHIEREAARIAEIRALRYQINPHFLYNCLNSLTALVRRKDTSQAEEMIGDLGQFIRFSLTVDAVGDVSLDSEVEMQQRYLDLEQRRFPERMKLELTVAPEVGAAALPPMILQPIVENAVKHGVGATSSTVTISIHATRQGSDRVSLVVMNSAEAGADEVPLALPAPGLGIGLANVSARLAARFGPTASCVAGPDGPQGYRVELSFPFTAVT